MITGRRSIMYIKLWDDILDSTVWMEEDHVIRVWLTFLLIANWFA